MPEAATLPPDQPQYVPGGAVPAAVAARPTPPIQATPIAPPQQAAGPASFGDAVPTNAGGISGGSNPYAPWSTDQIADYLVRNKAIALTPAQAKGAARWIHDRESRGDPMAFNPAGGGAGAFGMEQARGARQRALLTLYGPTPTTQQQADFMLHEFVTTEKPALQALKSASTEQGAYEAMGAAFERNPAAGEMQAGATPTFQEFTRRNQEMQEREGGEISRLMDEANKATPGSQERHQLMQQAMEHSDRLSHAFEELAAHPPTEKPVDMMQNFGSVATVIALLGGLMSRRPLTAALGAAGTAMMAMNSNNHEGFERAYKTWHDQTALVGQALSFQNQEINQILADERLSESERQERLMNQFRIFGMQHQLDQAGIGNWVEVYKMTEALQKMQIDLNKSLAQADYYKARTKLLGTGAGLNQYGDPPEKPSDDPNKPTQGSNIPQSVWDGATQLALTGHMPVLGNSAAGRAAIQSALPWVLAARGMTPADMVMQTVAYSGALAGSRTLGTRLANLNVGLSEVPPLGDRLVQISDATPRTEFMDVNRLIQATKLRTGDPQIIRLGAAMNSFLQGYARAINPTGVITDDIRAHVDYVLNQAMAKGQIAAGVDQLKQELTAMREGLSDAAQRGKAMFPLPGEKLPPSVPVPKAKYSATGKNNEKIYSDDGINWYGPDGHIITGQ